MTTNVEKPGGVAEFAAVLGTAYTPPRVNLLPPEITEARALRKVQAGLVAGIVVVTAGLAAAVVVQQGRVDDAQAALATEQSRTAVLNTEAAQYAEVPVVLAAVEAVESAQSTAMAQDVLWYDYLGAIAAAYPDGTSLSSITATMDTASGAQASGVSDPLATSGIGSVQFAGSAADNPDVASWLDALSQIPGYTNTTLSGATRSDQDGSSVVDFTTSVTMTSTVLSHRYDQKAS